MNAKQTVLDANLARTATTFQSLAPNAAPSWFGHRESLLSFGSRGRGGQISTIDSVSTDLAPQFLHVQIETWGGIPIFESIASPVFNKGSRPRE